ncbi:MAG: NAD(P)H-hydrate dehydratase [Candidatus Aminicenantes bacterium]|nr:NAD(P)H-hydrate dehydratase [Candidatus Aminicenantes bacterium]
MKVLNSSQMRQVDEKAIQKIGIIGPILMENAGSEIAREMMKHIPGIIQKKVCVVCGKGNNGGDGFVVARHLFNKGCSPVIVLCAQKKDLKGDAELNCRIADNMKIPIYEVTDEKEWTQIRSKVWDSEVIVDALFGTGLSDPVRGRYVQIIEDINASGSTIVAVDIPSGLSSDTFQIIGPCIKADLTVTMAAPKIPHVFPPAEEYVGEWMVADISTPSFLFQDKSINMELVEKQDLFSFFQKRENDTHKGTYGHLFILAGSLGKTGAASMAGRAALEMGAGLVTVGTPKSCLPIVARSMMELMTEPLEETPEWTLSKKSIKKIQTLLEGKDAVLIGPGISTHESTSKLIKSLLPELKIPALLDADALNIVSTDPEILKSMPQTVVVTPHPGEFARMMDVSTQKVVENKLELASEFAQEYGVYVVLKGYRTITATPEGMIFINSTGNPGMATGGAGDVLSGMIASLIMQGQDLCKAVLASVFVHGLSGDLAVKKRGEKSLVAGDLIEFLPQAVLTMSQNIK